MSLYDRSLSALPEIARRRSTARTIIAIGVIVAAIIGLVLLSTNFVAVAEWGREGTEDSSRARYRFGGGLIAPGLFVGGLVLIGFCIHYLFVDSRPWTRTATGTRLRKRSEGWLMGDEAFMNDLRARFASGDPRQYTPLPEHTKNGMVGITIWTAGDDRVGYVGLTYGPRKKTTRNAPFVILVGDAYDALDRALRNKLHKPYPRDEGPTTVSATGSGTTAGGQVPAAPAQPTAAAQPAAIPQATATAQPTAQTTAQQPAPAHLAPWIEYFASGRRFDVPVDAARLARARRWNTGVLVGTLIAVALAVALVVVTWRLENVRITLVIVGIVFVLLGSSVIVKNRRLRRRNLTRTDIDGVALTFTAQALTTPRVAELPWNEVTGIAVLDIRAQSEARLRVPIAGWGAALTLNGGDGSVAVSFVVRDGEGLRSAVRPHDGASAIRLWKRNAAGLQPGDYTIYPDVAIAPGEVERVIAASAAIAHAHGIPFHRSTSATEYARTLGGIAEPRD